MATSRIILPPPNSIKQKIIMNAMMTPGLRELWVACGTKFGKTWGASSGASARTLTNNGYLIRWVAPIYSQSKIGFKYCKKIFPPEPYTKVDNSDLSLTLTTIDSRLEFKSGKFPEDLEGEGVHGYVLDECSKMDRQVYDSAKTTTTVTKGPIMAISTPRSKNWFYEKCMQAKEEMEYAILKGVPPSKIFITAPSTDNPMVSAEAVEDARKSMPDRLFRQYYLAEFVDDGSVFTGYRDCLEGPDLPHVQGESCLWISPWYERNTVVIGADWAKTKDYTVFTAFDIVTRQMVGFQRFHKTPYTEAIRKLVLFSRKFADVIVVRHDRTGLGMVIDDQLSYTDLPYEGVTFTNANKAEMVAQLITSIEQRYIRLPRWEEMISEFESYEVTTNSIGNMSYSAVVGRHDDIVSSMLLSHSALLMYSDTGMDIGFLDGLNKSEDMTDRDNTNGKDSGEFNGMDPTAAFYRELLRDDLDD